MKKKTCPKCGTIAIFFANSTSDNDKTDGCWVCNAEAKGTAQAMEELMQKCHKNSENPNTFIFTRLIWTILALFLSVAAQNTTGRLKKVRPTIFRPHQIIINHATDGAEFIFKPAKNSFSVFLIALIILGVLGHFFFRDQFTFMNVNILFIIIGAWLAFIAISNTLLDRPSRKIKLVKNHLVVSYNSLNLFNKRINVLDIQQLYCMANQESSFTLCLRLKCGKNVCLFSSFDYESVRYMELEIEKSLGIVDADIFGEA